MKLHWVRPNDVDITACGKDSAAAVRPVTYLHAEAKNWLLVATKISQAYVCKKCDHAELAALAASTTQIPFLRVRA